MLCHSLFELLFLNTQNRARFCRRVKIPSFPPHSICSGGGVLLLACSLLCRNTIHTSHPPEDIFIICTRAILPHSPHPCHLFLYSKPRFPHFFHPVGSFPQSSTGNLNMYLSFFLPLSVVAAELEGTIEGKREGKGRHVKWDKVWGRRVGRGKTRTRLPGLNPPSTVSFASGNQTNLVVG